MRCILWLGVLLMFPCEAISQRPTQTPTQTKETVRPNIVFILIDDLRWDELGIAGHPFIKTPNIDRIGKEGAMFRNAFMTTPLCSPSRASFLTGQYAHTHGITDNVDRSAASHQLVTFPLLLHQSGYETAFIGKWHMGNDDTPRPGFDRWVSFKGQGTYLDPEHQRRRQGGQVARLHYRHPQRLRGGVHQAAARQAVSGLSGAQGHPSGSHPE